VTAVPFLALGFVVWQLWERALGWNDVVVFLATYIPCTLGITVAGLVEVALPPRPEPPAARAGLGALDAYRAG